MTFFENTKFVKKFNSLPYGKDTIMNIMKEIKVKNPDLTIDIFICMLIKKTRNSYTDTSYSSSLYISAVDLWNNYIFNSKKNFDFLIPYEGLEF
jgi:hypothetical protein